MFEQGASGGLVIYFLSPGRGGRGVLKYFGWVTIKNNLLPQQGSIILFASPPLTHPYWQLLGSHFAIAPLGTLVATNDTLSVPLNT